MISSPPYIWDWSFEDKALKYRIENCTASVHPIVINNITFVSRVFIIQSAAVLFDFTATLKNKNRAVLFSRVCAWKQEK